MESPVQLSIQMPHSLDTRIYIHLTVKTRAVTLFLTTATGEEAGSPTPIGSFVYALPDRFNPTQPLSTPLLTVEPTVELTTRLAKMLARKTQRPVYVSNSMSFAGAGLGGTVEEELEAQRQVIKVINTQLQRMGAIAPVEGQA